MPVEDSADIMLQLLYFDFLAGDYRFDHIPDRNQLDKILSFINGQVPEMLIRHECHTFFDGLVGMNEEYIRAHDFLNGSILGEFSLQYNFPGVIPSFKKPCN